MPKLKRFTISQATVEYSHCYVDAESEEQAIELVKEGKGSEWKFDQYDSTPGQELGLFMIEEEEISE